jgi:hypothetical protein
LKWRLPADLAGALSDAWILSRTPPSPDCGAHLRAIRDLRRIARAVSVSPAQRSEATVIADRMSRSVLTRFRTQFGFA